MMARMATAPITTADSVPVDRPEGLAVLVGDVVDVLDSNVLATERSVVVVVIDIVLDGLVATVDKVFDEVAAVDKVFDEVAAVVDRELESSWIQNWPVKKPPDVWSSMLPTALTALNQKGSELLPASSTVQMKNVSVVPTTKVSVYSEDREGSSNITC
jgi:hypothetical protein